MSQPTEDIATVRAEIDAARRQYGQERERLEELLGNSFQHPSSVADSVLSNAEEFGREHTVELLSTRQTEFGDQHSALHAEAIERAEELLARMEAAHDKLDELTTRRDQLEKPAKPGRALHIQGVEHFIEPDGRAVQGIIKSPERPLSLTQRVAQDRGVAPAEPAPPLSRTPTRQR